MASEDHSSGNVSAKIFASKDGEGYRFGNEKTVPEDYKPIGWIKDGENKIYINDREDEIVQYHGKPPELQQTDSLDENSTKSDIIPVITEFIEERDEYATMLELDHYIENRGYEPSGQYKWVGNKDSNVIFWMGDKEYIKAVLDCDKLNFMWQLNKESKYSDHRQELDRYNPVMSYQVAKRYGEYSYKKPKWRPVIINEK